VVCEISCDPKIMHATRLPKSSTIRDALRARLARAAVGAAPWLLASLTGVGCAAAAQNRSLASGTTPAQQEGALARLEQGADEQARHIAELETRLALLEQEARAWRENAASKHAETIRIGPHRREPDFDPEPVQTNVPVVRLHEAAAETLSMPPAPLGIAPKLPIVPLPEERAKAGAKSTAPNPNADPLGSYRLAVRLVSERHWNEALDALNRFLEQHPSGSAVPNALYWRGEVYYALRRYDDALHEFQALLSRFPACGKAADSLLKVGMCHLRLGDQAMAQRYFQQVREQFPSSDAARIASREGSS
jgi:tol-pal system protein YbgF